MSRATVARGDRGVAAFDLDGTLTRADTLLPFLMRVSGIRRTIEGLARLGCATATMRGIDRDVLKAILLRRSLRGLYFAAVDSEARKYAEQVVCSMIRQTVVDRVLVHRAAGLEIVIVSAALAIYVRPVAQALGITKVLATELEVRHERFTGELLGRNVRGVEKANRLRGFLQGASLQFAYGNSYDDLPFLEMADHPMLVRTTWRRAGDHVSSL